MILNSDTYSYYIDWHIDLNFSPWNKFYVWLILNFTFVRLYLDYFDLSVLSKILEMQIQNKMIDDSSLLSTHYFYNHFYCKLILLIALNHHLKEKKDKYFITHIHVSILKTINNLCSNTKTLNQYQSIDEMQLLRNWFRSHRCNKALKSDQWWIVLPNFLCMIFLHFWNMCFTTVTI